MQPSKELNKIIDDAELAVTIVNLKDGEVIPIDLVKGDATNFELWVIYKHPKDYPDFFVARKWIVDTPTSEALFAKSLNKLREQLPKHLIRLERTTFDDPVIVEVWM